MSFDHVMETACIQAITLLYIYFYIWELDLRLNNIIYYSSIFIILYSLSSILILIIIFITIELLNFWEYT